MKITKMDNIYKLEADTDKVLVPIDHSDIYGTIAYVSDVNGNIEEITKEEAEALIKVIQDKMI